MSCHVMSCHVMYVCMYVHIYFYIHTLRLTDIWINAWVNVAMAKPNWSIRCQVYPYCTIRSTPEKPVPVAEFATALGPLAC